MHGGHPERWTMPATQVSRGEESNVQAIVFRGDEPVAGGATAHQWPRLIASRADRPALTSQELKSLLTSLGGPGAMVISKSNAKQCMNAHAELGGTPLELSFRLRLYRHYPEAGQELSLDPDVRQARTPDLPFVQECIEQFAAVTGLPAPTDPEAAAANSVERGGIRVLEFNNEPSAIGQVGTCSAAGQVRIGLIYVPTHMRRRGFARRITLSMTAEAYSMNAVACLFTDATNPATDALYQSIGYQPIEELIHLQPETQDQTC